MRRNGELPENFQGWPRAVLRETLQQRDVEFEALKRGVHEALALRETASIESGDAAARRKRMFGALSSSNLEYTRDGRIIHRIFFSKQVMDAKRHGAILGSRGTTHRLLERETGCRICLGGRGITDLRNTRDGQDLEEARRLLSYDAHCQIIAPSELHLQRAIERIEFLVSDDPEAEELRERLKLQVDKDRGVKGATSAMSGGNNDSALTSAMMLASRRARENKNQNETGVVVNDDDEAGENAGEDTTADDLDAQDFLKNLSSL